jgi:endonuclease-3
MFLRMRRRARRFKFGFRWRGRLIRLRFRARRLEVVENHPLRNPGSGYRKFDRHRCLSWSDVLTKEALLRSGRIHQMPRAFSKDEIDDFFSRLKKMMPEPRTELQSVNPYTLLVAVVLSAQATDKGVNKATTPLFQIADTPQKMVALGVEKLTGYIKTIGLYRNKAKNVIALSKLLLERHGGEVPRTREELEALPGAGRKTANVVLNVAFGEKTIAVDTHIFRVCNRTNLAPGKNVLAVELGLEKKVPDKYKLHAHHWLILHGRYTCVARKPLCPTCVVRDLCRYKDKTKEVELPPTHQGRATTSAAKRRGRAGR